MFDVNPVPEGNMLSLNVTLDDSRIDIDLAIEAASFFGIKNDEAVKEAKDILSIVGRMWRPIAASYDIPRHAQEAMAPAFSLRAYSGHAPGGWPRLSIWRKPTGS